MERPEFMELLPKMPSRSQLWKRIRELEGQLEDMKEISKLNEICKRIQFALDT